MIVLACRGLSVVQGGVEALRGVDLEVRRGEVLGLVGPNGAGKSTLARALAGLANPSAGAVQLEGRPLAEWSRKAIATRIAHLAQELPTDLPFRAAEVVLMGRTPHLGPLGLEGPEDREKVSQALAAVEGLPFGPRPIAELSGGERRRVLLARILVQEAPVWILDEPTAHLDLAHQHLALRLARRHADDGGAVVCVLHDLGQAAEICDRLAMVQAGRLVAVGIPDEVLKEERLQTVFGVPFLRIEDPDTGERVLVPSLRGRGLSG